MSKLRINKSGIIAGILAGTMVLTGIGLSLKSTDTKELSRIENETGHTDINPFFNWNINEEDFVVLDVGDHNTVRTHFEDKKMQFCNDKDISLGIIVSSDSKTEAEIYNDVEYAKSIVKKYNIDFPVYLDINHIITDDDLNNEMKTKLIKDFMEKCSANNIYVGLYGTDTNLTRVKEYCDITEYDAYLVMDKEEITYNGTYRVIEDLNGNVNAAIDVSQLIDAKALNQANQFANDGAYTVLEGDELVDIALRYGMSVNELLEFNELKKDEIIPGTVLRIPSIIDKTVTGDLNVSYEELKEPLIGCDISYAQGDNIDWEQMSENFEFMILRVSQGTSQDSHFEINAKNANLNNIPIGVYCYNDFTLKDSEDHEDFAKKQESQADFVLELLKNKKIDYPVYLDIEAPNGHSLNEELDNIAVKDMIDIWVDKMTASGYIPGIYCNQSGFEFLQACLDYDLTQRVEIWIAGGEQYTGGTENIPFEEIMPSESVRENIPGAATVQSTDSAYGAGAGNSDGHLDINFTYKDYTDKTVTGATEETFAIKEFDRYDYSLIGMGIGAGIAAIGTTALAGTIIAKKKRSKERVRVNRK